jgi:Fe-S-cluster containining protein
VTVVAEEARTLAAAIGRMTSESQAEVRARLASNAANARGHTSSTYPFTPCALLTSDGRCSVYAERPFACRRAHSFDAEKCREAIEEGANVGMPSDVIALAVHAEFSMAFDEAVASSGGDARHYELHQAIEIVLGDPQGDLTPALDRSDAGDIMRDIAAVNPGFGEK